MILQSLFKKIRMELSGPHSVYIRDIFRRGFIFRQLFNRANPKKDSDYLSIAVIIKNEMPYLREWIEYHLIVGVDRFYIYDIESTDNPLEVLQPYIDKGIVIYKYFPGKAKQVSAYCDAILNYKYDTRWIAFVDIDEFIVPVQRFTLPEVLMDFEKYPGICVSYAMYDSSGHIKKPDGLVIKNYIHRNIDLTYRLNKSVKSIINPREVIVTNVHWCYYRGFKWGVNENGCQLVGNSAERQLLDILRVNHYYTRSKEEYLAKLNKGHAGTYGGNIPDAILDVSEERYIYPFYCVDNIMEKYVAELERRLITTSLKK